MPNKHEQFSIAVLDDYQGVALSMADWSVLEGRVSVTVFNDGGLKRSTQHFISDARDGVWRWSEDMVEASMWWLRRSCGTGGGVGNR
jgi:hypothetical protein